MGNIYCRKCGEPWDAYGIFHGYMTKKQLKKFLKGEGCPSCDFGKKVKNQTKLEREIFNEAFWTSLAENLLKVEDYASRT